MENQEIASSISILQSKINIIKEEIKLKELEMAELNKKLYDTAMIKFTWDTLRDWLIKNRPENNYNTNPIVSNGHHTSYCYIEDGELIVGCFGKSGDDRFRKGCDLFVPYDFKCWN